MAVLIRVENSGGVTGQCDKKCYNALFARCRCCCGGKNHGKGLKDATENTIKMSVQEILKYCEDNSIEASKVKVSRKIKQDELF